MTALSSIAIRPGCRVRSSVKDYLYQLYDYTVEPVLSTTITQSSDAHGWASAATFMDELVQRCQDGNELSVPGWHGAAALSYENFSCRVIYRIRVNRVLDVFMSCIFLIIGDCFRAEDSNCAKSGEGAKKLKRPKRALIKNSILCQRSIKGC